MARYTKDELNSCSKEMLITLLLSMQDQMEQLNTNMEKLIEQLAVSNHQKYGRSTEKLNTIDGQMTLDMIFNEAEALTTNLYVVEPAEDQPLLRGQRRQPSLDDPQGFFRFSQPLLQLRTGAELPQFFQIFFGPAQRVKLLQ